MKFLIKSSIEKCSERLFIKMVTYNLLIQQSVVSLRGVMKAVNPRWGHWGAKPAIGAVWQEFEVALDAPDAEPDDWLRIV